MEYFTIFIVVFPISRKTYFNREQLCTEGAISIV